MKTHHQIIWLMTMAVLLSACASSQTSPQVDEPMPETELTHTAIPDLEPVLLQNGDLPAGYTAGSSTSKVPTYYLKLFLPDTDYFIRVQIEEDSTVAGQVDALYYINQSTSRYAFEDIKGDMKDVNELTGIGEMAVMEIVSKSDLVVQDSIRITFTQCHVVIHISIQRINDPQIAISYGEILSERLKPYVCD